VKGNARHDRPVRTPHRSRVRLLGYLTALLLLALSVWQLPVFRLQTLVCQTELRSLRAADIEAASGFVPGQHLFAGLGGSWSHWLGLRYRAAEERIAAAFPAVKSVRISLDLPGRVVCRIEERIEVAWLAIPDGCVMIDKDGVVMSIRAERPGRIPLIEGLTVRSMTLGQALEVDVNDALHRAVGLLGAIIEADRDARPQVRLLGQVSQIRPVSGRQLYMTVVIPDTGEVITVRAEIGPELTDHMLWLRFAIDQDALNGRGKGILDLTGGNRTFIPDD
jgi:hypothetical protein